MFTCSVCHFDVELDDVEIRSVARRCVCLRCYLRETASARPLPKSLRRELSALLAALTPESLAH
jgi:hypothetical protein